VIVYRSAHSVGEIRRHRHRRQSLLRRSAGPWSDPRFRHSTDRRPWPARQIYW